MEPRNTNVKNNRQTLNDIGGVQGTYAEYVTLEQATANQWEVTCSFSGKVTTAMSSSIRKARELAAFLMLGELGVPQSPLTEETTEDFVTLLNDRRSGVNISYHFSRTESGSGWKVDLFFGKHHTMAEASQKSAAKKKAAQKMLGLLAENENEMDESKNESEKNDEKLKEGTEEEGKVERKDDHENLKENQEEKRGEQTELPERPPNVQEKEEKMNNSEGKNKKNNENLEKETEEAGNVGSEEKKRAEQTELPDRPPNVQEKEEKMNNSEGENKKNNENLEKETEEAGNVGSEEKKWGEQTELPERPPNVQEKEEKMNNRSEEKKRGEQTELPEGPPNVQGMIFTASMFDSQCVQLPEILLRLEPEKIQQADEGKSKRLIKKAVGLPVKSKTKNQQELSILKKVYVLRKKSREKMKVKSEEENFEAEDVSSLIHMAGANSDEECVSQVTQSGKMCSVSPVEAEINFASQSWYRSQQWVMWLLGAKKVW
ncbi:hypothetical protein ScPMuIL_005387 [Solemya velum]